MEPSSTIGNVVSGVDLKANYAVIPSIISQKFHSFLCKLGILLKTGKHSPRAVGCMSLAFQKSPSVPAFQRGFRVAMSPPSQGRGCPCTDSPADAGHSRTEPAQLLRSTCGSCALGLRLLCGPLAVHA